MRSATVWALAIFLLECLACPSWSATVIRDARIGIHPTHTRLVLDCTGDRPVAVYRRSDREWIIAFKALENPRAGRTLPQKPRGRIQQLQLTTEGPEPYLKALLKEDIAEARIFTLEDAQRPKSGYRLVIDFGLPGVASLRFDGPQQPVVAKPAGAEAEPASPSALPQVGEPDRVKSAFQEAPTQMTPPPSAAVTIENDPKAGESEAPGKKIIRPIQAQSPYDLADMTYEELKGALPGTAEQIVAAYQKAVQKDPQDPRNSLALLRIAHALDTAGDARKAERYYQRLIDEHPRDANAALAYIRLGEIHAARGNIMEALKVFQEAEKLPQKPENVARARLGTAQIYVQAGKSSEALEILKGLLEAYPDAYLHKPEIYKTLGEAAFAVKDYAASRAHLMRYINLAPDIPDKDIVLARIAESYLHEGERARADKIYAHIQVHYPDSEGDLIGRLRRAEYYETQGGELQEEAFKIYKDLESRPLAGPLKYFVQFKLAYADYLVGQEERSLQRIDAVLKSAEKVPVSDDLRQLRRKVLHSSVKKRFEAGDVKGVIDLYGEDPFAFQGQDAVEPLACVARAYESLGLCPDALSLYETLAQKDPKDLWKLAAARMAYEMGYVDKAKSTCLALTDPGLLDGKEELLVRIAFSQKDYAAVVRTGENLCKRRGGPEHCPADLAAMLALSYFETGKEDAAMPWAEHCLRRSDGGTPSLIVAASLKASRVRQKNHLYDQALQLLDLGIAKVQSEDLRNQLTYHKALVLLEQGKKTQAEKILAELLQSPKELWKTAAKQKLDYLRLQSATPQEQEKNPGAS